MKLRHVASVLGAGLIVLWLGRGRSSERPPMICPAGSNSIRVDTASHRLALCENGAAREAFSVRLGRNGTGKLAEGDRKTPLGTYPLGAPRASLAYGTFIPVGYPTEAQRQRGYTGSAVGVHGPHRSVMWLGPRVNAFDTTDGCIGLATDDAMDRIRRWTARTQANAIILE